MAPAHETLISICAARSRAIVLVLVLGSCVLVTASASAAAQPAAVASAATAPAPPVIIVGAPPPAASAPADPVGTSGGPVGERPPVIAPGASSNPVDHPSSPPPPPGPLDTRIITTTPRSSAFRPAGAQLTSGGPIVAATPASPRPAPVIRPLPPSPAPPRGLPTIARGLPLFAAPPAPAARVSVSVPMEGVFLSGSTSARRPGQRAVAAVGLPVGPAGLGSVSLRSPWGSPVPGGSAWLGSAPVSSSGTSGASLLGLNALLVALTLLGAGSWRRGWVCPEVGLESLVLASALDRPG